MAPSPCSPRYKLPNKWGLPLETNEEKLSLKRTIYSNLAWQCWISDPISLLVVKRSQAKKKGERNHISYFAAFQMTSFIVPILACPRDWTYKLNNKVAKTLWWDGCYSVTVLSLWGDSWRRSYSGRFYSTAKVNPRQFTSITSQVRCPPCCHKARRHFKVIFLMSNFTLGYAWVERIRAATIFHTLASGAIYFSVYVPSFWGDGVLMSRQPDGFWLRSYRALAKAFRLPPHFAWTQEGRGGNMGNQWTAAPGVSVNSKGQGETLRCRQVAVW